MKITHVALWVSDLEKMKEFYCKYFKGIPGERYENPKKGFTSYFVQFDSETKLELMKKEGIEPAQDFEHANLQTGFSHIAISVGSEYEVDEYTRNLAEAGFQVVSGPRRTGDGYYESVILDPENNFLEITV